MKTTSFLISLAGASSVLATDQIKHPHAPPKSYHEPKKYDYEDDKHPYTPAKKHHGPPDMKSCGMPPKYGKEHDSFSGYPFEDHDFTSTYSVIATPDQVVNSTEDGSVVYTGGLPGAIGYFNFGIDTSTNTICYDITLYGFKGQYESPADTATHMHEGLAGAVGPPRIAFPNPVPQKGGARVSAGCLIGPFETGIINEDTGMDTGAGFEVSQIESDPMGFFCDVHSSLAVPGAVRGQLA